MSLQGIENELNLKIEECNSLHRELHHRPIRVNECSLKNVNPEYGCSKNKEIADLIRSNERFNVKVEYQGELFWVMPIYCDEDDYCYGIVNNEVLHPDINFNDLIGFTANDVLSIYTNQE
jgi:hypothetical protein